MKIPGRLRLFAGLSPLIIAAFFGAATYAQSPGPVTRNTTVSVGVGDTVMAITGSTSPGALVIFEENNGIIGSTSADSTGTFIQNFPAQTPGIHTVRIFAEDSSGRITDTIEISINLIEHFTTTTDVFLPPTISLASADVTQGEGLLIVGETFPGAQVQIVLDGQTIAFAGTNASGRWGFMLVTDSLSPGVHQVYVTAQKSGGGQSFPTAARTFTVMLPPAGDPAPPGATVTPRLGGSPAAKPSAPVITSPKTGDIVDGDEVTVRGTAPPNAQIEIWNRGRPIGSIFANGYGDWWVSVQLNEYAYELVARACVRGVCSDFSSPPVTFFRKAPPANRFSIELEKYMLRGNTQKPVIAHLFIRDGTGPYKINIDWGDGKKDSFTTSETELNVGHRYRTAGHYNAVIYGTDANGYTAHAAFSAEINEGPDTYWLSNSLLLWLLLLLALGAYIIWRRNKERYDRPD